MKAVHWTIGMVATISMIIILLITSFEIASYSDFNWYQKTYEKYDVATDLEMEMSDIMEVTREMMKYLKGNREDLVVNTTIAGEEREFFNDREKAHMVDVQGLFIGGMKLRFVSIVICVAAILILVLMKADWKRILPKCFIYGTCGFIGLLVILALLCMSDFTKYFTIFHEIFFDNDLWLLDWNTDWLIRMLPEGFFVDMVIRIGSIFAVLLIVFGGFSAWMLRKTKK